MNWLDIILFCLLGAGFVKGLFDGFVKQIVSFISLAAGIFFCRRLGDRLESTLIELDWFPKEGIEVMSTIIAFILIIMLLSFTGSLLSKVIAATPLGPIDHFAGGFFGLSVVLLFTSLLINLVETVDRRSFLLKEKYKKESILYEPTREVIPMIYPL